MANFQGGSAPAMAAQIAEGYLLLSNHSLRGLLPGDLNLLKAELEKLLRTVRSEAPPADDAAAQQTRNRKIARLGSSVQVIQNQLMQRR